MLIASTEEKRNEDELILFCFKTIFEEYYPFIHRLEEIGVSIKNPIKRYEYMKIVYMLRMRTESILSTNNNEIDSGISTYLLPDEMQKLITTLFNLSVSNKESDY